LSKDVEEGEIDKVMAKQPELVQQNTGFAVQKKQGFQS
jgi:hypothetical protein